MPIIVDGASIANILLITADLRSASRIIRSLTELNRDYRGGQISFVITPAYYVGMIDLSNIGGGRFDALITDRTIRALQSDGQYAAVKLPRLIRDAFGQRLFAVEAFRDQPRPLGMHEAEVVAKNTLTRLRRSLAGNSRG